MALGRHQGRAAAEEGIEDDVAAARAVENRVGDHGNRLYRQVKRGKLSFLTRAAESGTARLGPDVGSVPAVAAELNIVAVRSGPCLEDKDELVLRAIEAPHFGVGLRPHAEIDCLERIGPRRGEQLPDMTPIHADIYEAIGMAGSRQEA